MRKALSALAPAVRQIADLAGVDQEKAAEALPAIEAQRAVTRELLMRRIAEKWLEGQRRGRGGLCGNDLRPQTVSPETG